MVGAAEEFFSSTHHGGLRELAIGRPARILLSSKFFCPTEEVSVVGLVGSGGKSGSLAVSGGSPCIDGVRGVSRVSSICSIVSSGTCPRRCDWRSLALVSASRIKSLPPKSSFGEITFCFLPLSRSDERHSVSSRGDA